MLTNGYMDADGVWVEQNNGVYDATNLPPPPPPPDPMSPFPRKVVLQTQLGNFALNVDELRSKANYFQGLLGQLDPSGQVYNTVLHALQPKISAEFADGTSRSMSPLGESASPLSLLSGKGDIVKVAVALFAVYGIVALLRRKK